VSTNEVIDRVLPQFFPKHWLETAEIVCTDFPSRIRIGYVLRSDGRYSYIMKPEFTALSISLEEFHAAALTNLGRLDSATISVGKVPGGSEAWISANDDNFAAARILLPEVQHEFQCELGEEFLVSLTNRDDCFCWSLTQSAERQEKHARETLAHFLEDEYNLTPDILLYSHNWFRLHREQPIC